jgi:predicted Zn-dependent protease
MAAEQTPSVWHEILGWGQEQVAELRLLAFCYARQGVYSVARDLLHMIQVVRPEEAYEAQLLGALYLEEGELKQALSWLETALRLDASHLPTQLNYCKALLQSGKTQEGLQDAARLSRSAEPAIANDAQALLLAYRVAA